jgi:predicted amidophosphoribosyltransferase
VFSRRLNRGFEPASLAAREAARAMGVPFSRVLTLKRTPSPQKGLTAVQRRDNLRGVFGVKARTLADMRVLLVDDVTTTGTTLREAATVLAKAGAEVYAATVAMTPERALDMGMDVDDPRVGVNSPARGTA